MRDMVTGSKDLIRDINVHLVLNTIIKDGPLSRAAISQQLGLTKATISAIVAELIDKSYIREMGSDDTSLGRKPILLTFCKENGTIVSVDVGAEYITILLSDLCGNNCVLKQYTNEYDRENVIEGLKKCIDDSLTDVRDTHFGVVGISVGIHGIINKNEILFTPYYDYAGLPIGEELNKYYNIPVILENEANLSVIGEKNFYYNVENLIGISVHSGIGAGIIIGDKLYTGANGYAGEFGHTIVVEGGRECPCKNKGCLEQYASEKAILDEFAQLKGRKSVTIDEFVAAYSAHDKYALEMMEQFIRFISVGINNLLNCFNPNVIVINSSFTIYIPDIIPKIKAQIKNRLVDYLELVPSGLQDTSILLGGVCIIRDEFLREI